MKTFRYLFPLTLLALLVACTPDEPTVNPDPTGKDSVIVKPGDDPDDPTIVETPDQKRDLAYLFDMDAVPEVTISLTEADWNTYLSNYDENFNNDLYVPARWTFKKGNDVYSRDSVGLRPRGNTSRRRPEGSDGEMHSATAQWHHAHFGVCFTKYETGERFFGMDRLQLKWAKDDPTYVHEVFSYDLMRRAGVWSAPHASHIRLSIHIDGDPNPVYMGVYAMIENPRTGWMHDRMKEGNIPDNDGNMWKCSWGANLSDIQDYQMGLSDAATGQNFVYDLKTNKKHLDEAKQELTGFVNELRSLSDGSDALNLWLEEHMDVSLFIRAMAVDVAVGQWDGYWGNNNNFFLYFDSNHRLYFIPFDMDNTLGTGLPSYGNPGTQDPMNWGPLGSDRLLWHKILSIDANWYTFRGLLTSLVTDPLLMEPDAAIARVKKMQALIRPYVDNDTNEDCQIEDVPAGWGVFSRYHLLTGSTGDGEWEDANFFRTKAAAIASAPQNPN